MGRRLKRSIERPVNGKIDGDLCRLLEQVNHAHRTNTITLALRARQESKKTSPTPSGKSENP